ncbi:hypothetical protein OAL55_05040, partial [Verrucomicrobiales bacterium]|nr:hypothetical protein [Verrucomicrobiales bacterium]
ASTSGPGRIPGNGGGGGGRGGSKGVAFETSIPVFEEDGLVRIPFVLRLGELRSATISLRAATEGRDITAESWENETGSVFPFRIEAAEIFKVEKAGEGKMDISTLACEVDGEWRVLVELEIPKSTASGELKIRSFSNEFELVIHAV